MHGFPGLSALKQSLKHLFILTFLRAIGRMPVHANELVHISIDGLNCPFDEDVPCRSSFGSTLPKRIAGLLAYIVRAGSIHNLLGCLCETGRCRSLPSGIAKLVGVERA